MKSNLTDKVYYNPLKKNAFFQKKSSKKNAIIDV